MQVTQSDVATLHDALGTVQNALVRALVEGIHKNQHELTHMIASLAADLDQFRDKLLLDA